MHSPTISAARLNVPDKAINEYQKACGDLRNNKLDHAVQHMRKAVGTYPQYAAAWVVLGQILDWQQKRADAHQACSQAMRVDSAYIPPYVCLSDFAAREGDWDQVSVLIDRAQAVDPIGNMFTFYFAGRAQFHFQQFQLAEASVKQALKLDKEHRVPELHYLLARIYQAKGDSRNEASELQQYLRAAPNAANAAQAKTLLAHIDDLRAASPTQTQSEVLKVTLRMPDDSAFSGKASIRVTPGAGPELAGTPSGSDTDMIFAGASAGTYTIEVSAPGFLGLRKQASLEAGGGLQTVFLTMEPLPETATTEATSQPSVSPGDVAGALADPARPPWIPPDIDAVVPSVKAGVECPLAQVVSGAGQRMTELVDNLQKFDATETVEHFKVNAAGSRGKPDTRVFDYVVAVRPSPSGIILLDEYRNGSLDPTQFPAGIATLGLSSMAMLFHPRLVSDFDLVCEGLGESGGRPAWQIHFTQRSDRPNRMRAYVIEQHYYPLPLKGRAWIDADTYQVRRLETQLLKPVGEISLRQEDIDIDYAPVQFQAEQRELWLPQAAELYVDWKGQHYYRRHTFGNFKLFGVDSSQEIQAPKASYCFRNTSAHEISGVLTVSPIAKSSAQVASVHFSIPAGGSVCKLVGMGKDVNIPADQVDSATFIHDGLAGTITADASAVRVSNLDIIP